MLFGDKYIQGILHICLLMSSAKALRNQNWKNWKNKTIMDFVTC